MKNYLTNTLNLKALLLNLLGMPHRTTVDVIVRGCRGRWCPRVLLRLSSGAPDCCLCSGWVDSTVCCTGDKAQARWPVFCSVGLDRALSMVPFSMFCFHMLSRSVPGRMITGQQNKQLVLHQFSQVETALQGLRHSGMSEPWVRSQGSSGNAQLTCCRLRINHSPSHVTS